MHALEVHASLIQKLWETDAVTDAVGELQTAFARIECEAWKMDNQMEGVAKKIKKLWIAPTKVGDTFRQIESANR